MLVPSLIGFLRPTQGLGVLHETALQVLLKLALSVPGDFKTQVTGLTEFEKQQLEASVKLSVASQQQQATQRVETVKTAVPLKLDFSKYA